MWTGAIWHLRKKRTSLLPFGHTVILPLAQRLLGENPYYLFVRFQTKSASTPSLPYISTDYVWKRNTNVWPIMFENEIRTYCRPVSWFLLPVNQTNKSASLCILAKPFRWCFSARDLQFGTLFPHPSDRLFSLSLHPLRQQYNFAITEINDSTYGELCAISQSGLEKSVRIVAFCDWKARFCDQKTWCSRNFAPKTRRPGASLWPDEHSSRPDSENKN